MESHLATPSAVLGLADVEMQRVLDASWSRRQRWDAFQPILDLLQRFDPQQGDLPILLRRYVNDNLVQPFNASQNSEPKIWGLLSVAADHFDFLQFIVGFVGNVPSSKPTTELLFLLDKLIQANLSAAVSLINLDIGPGTEWTKSVSPNGVKVLVMLRAHYERALGERGLWGEAALALQYDESRIRVLDHLVRTTPEGYRASDAQFLIGETYWQQGRRQEAVHIWSRIVPHAADEYFDVLLRGAFEYRD